MKPRHLPVLLGAAVGLAACGGSGSSPRTPTTPSPPAPPQAAALTPTFSSIRTQVFQTYCVGCHSSAAPAPPGELRLDANVAYGNLVNVRSTGKAGAVRVVPGNPDDSYLIHKLAGRSDIVGSRMPLGGPFLSDADIGVIRTWIAEGAQNN